MIVFTTKISLKKTVIGLCALCAVIWGITALAPRAVQSVDGQARSMPKITEKIKTNEERVALLEGFGWQVNPQPTVEMEVQIPKEFDAAYDRYNELQRAQGLDLEKYQGKRAMLYIYELEDYPTGAQGVTVSMVVYKNRLIAADVSSGEADGFTHGITEIPVREETAADDAQTEDGEAQNPEQTAAEQDGGADAESAPGSEETAAPSEQDAPEGEGPEDGE